MNVTGERDISCSTRLNNQELIALTSSTLPSMDVKTARSGPFTHARTHSSTHAHSHSHPIAADFRLLGGPAATTKQPKGKQKENEHWNFNWWDYTALIESRKS